MALALCSDVRRTQLVHIGDSSASVVNVVDVNRLARLLLADDLVDQTGVKRRSGAEKGLAVHHAAQCVMTGLAADLALVRRDNALGDALEHLHTLTVYALIALGDRARQVDHHLTDWRASRRVRTCHHDRRGRTGKALHLGAGMYTLTGRIAQQAVHLKTRKDRAAAGVDLQHKFLVCGIFSKRRPDIRRTGRRDTPPAQDRRVTVGHNVTV